MDYKLKSYTTKNIFISSTFVDMQLERDYLIKRVLPVVKEYALKYHINIEFVDLRFGIDIGNKNEVEKVIETCSDEIDRCKPLFIAFLGNRFGTKIENTNESITSFEINHAIKENCECLFYFRNIDNSSELSETEYNKYFSENEEVEKLKVSLKEKYNNFCKEYNVTFNYENNELTFEDDFSDMLINDICKLLDSVYQDDEDINNNLYQHYEYMNFLMKDYAYIHNNVTEYLDNISDHNDKIITIYGESGSGKSMILSSFIKGLLEKQVTVIPYYIAASSDNTILNIVNTYLEYVCRLLNKEYLYINNEDEAVEEFYNALSNIKENIIFTLDEFDQVDISKNKDKLSWLRKEDIPGNVKFVITTASHDDAMNLEYEGNVLNLVEIDSSVIKSYVDYILKVKNQKTSEKFYDTLVKSLQKRLKGKTFLHLKTYLEYIFYNDRIDALRISEISNLSKKGKLSGVDKGVLDFYLDKISNMSNDLNVLIPQIFEKKLERFDVKLAQTILCLLTISINGIRESDIKSVCEILGVNYLNSEFAYLRKSMPSYFYQNSTGAWRYTHRLIQKSFIKYFEENEFTKEVKSALLKHIKSLNNDDEFKVYNLLPLLKEFCEYDEIYKHLVELIDEGDEFKIELASRYITYFARNNDEFFDLLFTGSNNFEDTKKIIYFIIESVMPYEANISEYGDDYLLNWNEQLRKYALDDPIVVTYLYVQTVACIAFVSEEDVENRSIISNLYKYVTHLYYSPITWKTRENLNKILFDLVEFYKSKDEDDTASNVLTAMLRMVKTMYYDKHDNYYYNVLTKIYLEKASSLINNGNNKEASPFIKEVSKNIINQKIDVDTIDEFVDVVYDISVNEFANSKYTQALKNLDLILNATSKERNEKKTLEAIEVYLEIKYFKLCVLLKSGGFTKQLVLDLKEEFEYLYSRSNSDYAKFYLYALDEMLVLFEENSLDRVNKLADLVIKKVELLKNIEYTDREYYSLLISTSEYMNSVHDYAAKTNMLSYHKEHLDNYKSIYDFINTHTDLLDLDISKLYLKEVLFFLALAETGNAQIEYMEKELEIAVDIFKKTISYNDIISLVNDCFYYFDMQIERKKFIQCLDVINIAKESLSYYHLSTGEELDTYNNKLSQYENYIMKNIDPKKLPKVKRETEAINEDNEDIVSGYSKLEDISIPDDFDINEAMKSYNEELLNNNKYSEIDHLRFTENHNFNHETCDGEYTVEFWNDQINKGYTIGYFYAGLKYERQKNYEVALSYYEKGAESGCLACMNALGYYYGNDGRFDEAFNWQLKSALSGYLYAIENVLRSYKNRLEKIEGVYEKLMAKIYLNLMSSEHDQVNPTALQCAKLCISYGDLDVEAYEWFLKYYNYVTISQTHGMRRQTAVGADSMNEEEIWIFRLRKDAVVNKNAESMSYLAYQYSLGKHLNVDYDKVLYWTNKARKLGDYTMCYYCGFMLFTGDSTLELNHDLAAELLLDSLKSDHVEEHEQAIKALQNIKKNKMCSEETLEKLNNF